MTSLSITEAEMDRLAQEQHNHRTYVTFSADRTLLLLPTPRWALAELAAMRGIDLEELLK